MSAFVPSTNNLFNSSRSSFVGTNTKDVRSSTQYQIPVRRSNLITPTMNLDSIDFSKVNIQGAGENLAGLVFVPDTDSQVATRVDVGYTSEQEEAVNKHINVEYTASYAYHAIWSYFDRDTVALPGFAHYFSEQSKEEREHAEEFMQYQNKRGGCVQLQPIAVPELKFEMKDGTSDALYAMDLHLQLEKFVFHKLNDLRKVAESADDAQMQDFLDDYLSHQVDAIKTAADYVAQLKRVGTPHGVYHFDLQLREENAVAA